MGYSMRSSGKERRHHGPQEDRKDAEGVSRYPWDQTEFGRVAKCVALIGQYISCHDAHKTVDTGEFATDAFLLGLVTGVMPFFPEEFKKVTGKDLTGDHLHRRVTNMFSRKGTDGGMIFEISPEHPTRKEILKAIFPRVEKFFQKNFQMTREQALELGRLEQKENKAA